MASPVRGDLLDLKPENFDKVLDVNLRGTVFFSQAVAARHARRSRQRRPLDHHRHLGQRRIRLAGTSRLLRLQGGALHVGEEPRAPPRRRRHLRLRGQAGHHPHRHDGGRDGKIRWPDREGLVPSRRWGEASDVGLAVATLAAGTLGFATGSILNVDGALSVRRL